MNWQEGCLLLVKKVKGKAIISATILACLMIPFLTRDRYILGVFIILFFNCAFSVSLYPMLKAGLFSVAQGAFLAIGAYTATILVMKVGVNCWLAILVAGIASMIVATSFGIPSLRVKFLYFFLVTFGFNEVVRLSISNCSYLGRSEGITNIPYISIGISGLFHVDFTSPVYYFYLIFFLFIMISVLFWQLCSSQMGRIFWAIHLDENLSESIGLNVLKYKIIIFAASSFFAGILGAFYAYYYQFIAPSDFNILVSMFPLFCIAIGGLSSFSGAIIGAVVLTLVPEIFRFTEAYQPIVFGTILVVIMLFLQDGLVSLPRKLKSKMPETISR